MKSLNALLAACLLFPLGAQEKDKLPATSLDAVLFDEALWSKSLEDLQSATKPEAEVIKKTDTGTVRRIPKGME